MKKVLGISLLLLLTGGIFYTTVISSGLIPALAMWAVAGLLTALLVLAVTWIVD